VRADEGVWEPLVEGVERKLLWHDRTSGRLTFLIRAQPGSRFPPHTHDEDEEAYLLSGELIFGSLTLRAGDYHRAGRGAAHTVGLTPTGCMLLVTAAA
jgi:quercetin dioxygenase-like cupin family protein